MVQVEGQGKQPPAQHELVLTTAAIRTLLGEARKRQEFRGYSSGNTTWKRGLMDGETIPGVGTVDGATRSILVGLVGEYAIGWMLERRCQIKSALDLVLRCVGDGGSDFVVNGVTLDVKTRRKDYGSFLIRQSDDSGRPIDHTASAFPFVTWYSGLVAHVHGFVWRDELASYPVRAARRGDHSNYEIQPSELLPMSRLFDFIRSREIWR